MQNGMNTNVTGEEPKRVAVITGASRGIGLELAKTLSPSFQSLALVASNESSFDTVRDQFGSHVSLHWADFSSPSELRRLAAEISEVHDHIDVLIHNCGAYEQGPFEEASLDALERMLDVNARAPIALTRLLLDQLKKGTDALVVNMSSIQATNLDASLVSYAASKAALSAFSEGLRKELNPLNIRVTTIEPSGVNTWGEVNPIGLLSPADVAQVIKFIVDQDPRVQVNRIVLSGM